MCVLILYGLVSCARLFIKLLLRQLTIKDISELRMRLNVMILRLETCQVLFWATWYPGFYTEHIGVRPGNAVGCLTHAHCRSCKCVSLTQEAITICSRTLNNNC
ncbi:unnamed protein product [Spodoptera littoralis]|uniref:Uncharacterized protein n=1 Tax=Spodoptera littoralis TaxID=7109 RepID=A0A9P0MVH3_SPOLI|nr:unnamed protein product [Spodoptera littoralis]CAH1634876.1 unnamed protein product [Spodoptera littoralis]